MLLPETPEGGGQSIAERLAARAAENGHRQLAMLFYGWHHRRLWQRRDAAELEQYLGWLSLLLHEPMARCRRLLRSHIAHLQWLEQRRHTRQSADRIRASRDEIIWPQREDYRAAAWQQGQSRIMAAYHFGDYIHCLAPLAQMDVRWRHRILIRQQRGSRNSDANLQDSYRQMGLPPPQLLYSGELDLLRLRHQLKYGLCSVTTFCDLPANSGVTTRVNFLGQHAWFNCGVAALAISAGVPVLPVITFHDGQHNQLHIEPMLSSKLCPGESQQDGCRRLTQALVDILQRRLQRHPGQWRYLTALPQYFRPPQPVAGIVKD